VEVVALAFEERRGQRREFGVVVDQQYIDGTAHVSRDTADVQTIVGCLVTLCSCLILDVYMSRVRIRDRMAGDSIRVLHVDDDRDFVDLAALFLERADSGLEVHSETNVPRALERLRTESFDCVVSDFDMPGQNGLAFLGEVRQVDDSLPFILFTGKGSEEVASEAISAGVTDYLQKESGRDQFTVLANRIRTVVEGARAKEAVGASESRLRQMLERITDGFIALNDDWEYTFVSDAAAAFAGRPREELLGRTLWETFPELRGTSFEDAVRTAMETQETATAEAYFPPHDRWYSLRVYPDEDGVSAYFRDVTEREQQVQEVARTRDVLSTLLSELPVAVLAEDGDRSVLATNRRLTDLLDVADPPADLVGVAGESLLSSVRESAVDPEAFGAAVEHRVAAGEPVPPTEFDLVDDRTLEVSYTPLELGDEQGHLWVFRDLTDRKERELKLELLHERTRELMDTLTVSETVEVATAAADDIIGAPLSGVHLHDEEVDRLVPTVVMGGVDDLFEEVPRYDRGAPSGSRAAVVWEAFECGEPLYVDDVQAHDGLTEQTPARSVVVHPLADHGVFIVSSPEPNVFDETDKRLVDVLAVSLTAALDRVAREAELRERRDELQRRNERLSEFASVVSHDLRNPLSVATGRVELAREERASEDLDVAARALDRIGTLIDDLLTLARTGEPLADREEVPLREVADRCWANVETRDARLALETTRLVRADASRLEQLLENLFRNAVEHGGSAVTVRVGDLSDADGFYVADDGAGVPPDLRSRVFEGGFTTRTEGTGFGLAIVRQVAEAHDWTVRLTESEGGGARFEFAGLGPEA
jgi:PAS domain S-box-containing protein